MIQEKEIAILRGLAREYAQYANLPEQKERRRLWRALNSGTMERPMVLIDQLPWIEMDIDGFLQCQVKDPYWRDVEWRLRKDIYKWRHMRVDMVLNPYLSLYVPTIETGWGVEIIDEQIEHEKGNDIVAHAYVNQFQSMEDVAKIQTPTIRRNQEAEKLVRQQADVLFEGIIPYRMCGAKGEGVGFRVGPWDWITQWMGVTDIYMAIMDEPELIHAIMTRMMDGLVRLIDQYSREGLFDIETNMIHCSQTFSDDIPEPGCDHNHPQAKDAWGFGLAQLFSSVSPSITKEFEADYMMRTFPLMGAVYYGCCERLDDRLEIVSQLPNVRKISCSPWSNREIFAEKLPAHIVMSCKPTPAVLATDSFDLEAARRDLRKSIEAAKRYGKRLEFIMKDISTVRHQPQRIWEWANMAAEEVEKDQ